LEDNLQAHKLLVEMGSQLLGHPRLNGSPAPDEYLSREDAWKLNTEVTRRKAENLSRARSVEDAETRRRKELFNETLKWIFPLEDRAEEIHHRGCEARANYPGTCDWIMEDKGVEEWRENPEPEQSILWINGSMGVGESP
jgi:hypothetical protein